MDESIAAWLKVLDRVSHYELLGVQPDAGADTIKRAYQAFAANFHPDAHGHRSAAERTSVNTIFKRGTEAYRILSDATLRARYEEQVTGRSSSPGGGRTAPLPRGSELPPGSSSPSPPSTSSPSVTPGTSGTSVTSKGAATAAATKTDAPKPGSASKSNITGRLEDFVRNPRARPFAQQAEALAKKGEHGKAKLQLKLAMNFDPGNDALAGYLKELDSLIELDKKKPYQPK